MDTAIQMQQSGLTKPTQAIAGETRTASVEGTGKTVEADNTAAHNSTVGTQPSRPLVEEDTQAEKSFLAKGQHPKVQDKSRLQPST